MAVALVCSFIFEFWLVSDAYIQAEGTATLDRATKSNHFMKNQTIRLPTAASSPSVPAPLPAQLPSSNDSLLLQLLLSNPNGLHALQNSPFPLLSANLLVPTPTVVAIFPPPLHRSFSEGKPDRL
jgi:hypothetical protein